jgi:protein SHQ1
VSAINSFFFLGTKTTTARMLTPLFDLQQDDFFVILVIRVPYMKASELDYYIMGNEFKFFARPYYLRLTFPHPLAEDGSEKASYDIQKGELTIHLPKLHKGTLLA